MCLGDEDLNEHTTLRTDVALQPALERTVTLASAAPRCRLENRADRAVRWRLHEGLVEPCIASFDTPPTELVLDVDATDDPVHGRQEPRFFHGDDAQYCVLPLSVFGGDQLLVSYLRPSNLDGAKHAWAMLAVLVKRLRRAWPQVRIRIRADSGCCRWRMLSWGEHYGVQYLLGVAKTARLNRLAEPYLAPAAKAVADTAQAQRGVAETEYGAASWDRARRVLIQAEHPAPGANPRYVVTTLSGKPQYRYERVYCQRGEMENRIKAQQLDLFAERTRCHRWWPNHFRLWLASLG